MNQIKFFLGKLSLVGSYLRLTKLSFYLCSIFSILLFVFNRISSYSPTSWIFYLKIFFSILAATTIYSAFHLLVWYKSDWIERQSQDQAKFLDDIPVLYIDLAILVSAALSIFLELAIIRWQSEVFPIFAFYKNYSLLSCFAGLGFGYALAKRKAISLFLCLPIIVFQFFFLIFLRHGIPHRAIIEAAPFAEQLNMGLGVGTKLPHLAVIYFFLTTVFLLNVLSFIPIGQLCGRLMTKRENLRAYGFNLLGSILGVVLMGTVSFFWTPPVIWFCIGFAGLLIFQVFNARLLLVGILAALTGFIILSWPISPGYERLHSPYQLLERGPGERGLTMIKAAGHYYQRIHDLNLSNRNRNIDQQLQATGDYYELPYRLYGKSLRQILIVGSGTGNDVAAALRSGAEHVDAIEIDPGILKLGRMYHPENPYGDSRVTAIVNDARTFIRTTDTDYDMIVYGLLDSHTLLSHASSIRLDSFVYTIEGLKEARRQLKPNGLLSLSFAVMSDEIGRKIYLMMKEAFEGEAPICVRATYDGAVIFFQARDGSFALSDDLLTSTGFEDITGDYANSDIQADISTDDWPFFYMPKRIYPVSYLGILGLVVLLSIITSYNFMNQKLAFNSAAFFFLGAGFMLIETKAITELGLTFGNTWEVIGIAISGVLFMAFLANGVVQWFNIHRVTPWFIFLSLSLLLGFQIAGQGGFGSSVLDKIYSVLLLTCPIFFSGIVLSTLLARTNDVAGAMSINILGAMTGGVLEYNSMYFGFRFLYLLALFMYVLAILSYFVSKKFKTIV